METQIELFPLPKKQKSLFGKAKGTVLGESPVNSRQNFDNTTVIENENLRSSKSEGVLKSAEIRESNYAFMPGYHRCDPKKPTTRGLGGDKAKQQPLIEEIDDDADAFIEEILEETNEEEPITDCNNEPLPAIEEEEPIRILGQVTHLDPTHANPYEQNESFWHSIRQSFQRLFGI